MQIYVVPCLTDNYAYILRDDAKNTTSVIDACDPSRIESFLNQKKWNLNFILSTHHHEDHVGGNLMLKAKFDCRVLGPSAEQKKIPALDLALVDSQIFELGSTSFTAISVPGHTLGQISYYFVRESVLFTGDTLFSMGCGRLFEGTPQQMFKSLQKIKNLPPQTLIYCGHEYSQRNAEFCLKHAPNADVETHYKHVMELREKNKPTVPTTLDLELKINPFLRAPTLNEFIRLRELRDQW